MLKKGDMSDSMLWGKYQGLNSFGVFRGKIEALCIS